MANATLTEELLNELFRNVIDAINSWALWESSNGFPHSSNRWAMRERLKDTNEGVPVIAIQIGLLYSTLFALGRLLDSGIGNKRYCIERVKDLENWQTISGRDEGLSKVVAQVSLFRQRLKPFRDYYLAHSIEIKKPAEFKVREIRRCLTFCAVAVSRIWRAFHPESLDLELRGGWRRAVRSSQKFWDRYEQSLPESKG